MRSKIIDAKDGFEVSPTFKRQKNASGKNAQSFLKKLARNSSSSGSKYGKKTGKTHFVKSGYAAQQRVIVKSRIVKGKGSNIAEHVKYVTREGVEINENAEKEINIKGSENTSEFIKKIEEDRHHFRIIISPENAHDLDLNAYQNQLIKRLESDLNTKLEYMTVNHYNTDNPHMHLIIRGVDDKGKDLVISREYMSNGMRGRSSEIATDMLGHRTELDINQGVTREVSREAFTQIDRDLLKLCEKDKPGIVVMKKNHENDFKQSVRVQRLAVLRNLGLAKEVNPGIWKLDSDMELKLRELGTRNDIIKTMNRNLTTQHNSQEKVIFDPSNPNHAKITGVVIDKGLSDEMKDDKYMILSATDNRIYYVPLSKYSERDVSRIGSIVSITANRADNHVLKSDENIISIADKNNGIYVPKAHEESINKYKLPPGITPQDIVNNHIKRLESLEKKGLVEKGETGWKVPSNLRESIKNMRGNKSFAHVTLESTDSLEYQINSKYPAWIDKNLEGYRERNDVIHNDIDRARAQRIEVLHGMGVAERTPEGLKLDKSFKQELERRNNKQIEKNKGIER